MSRKRQAPGSAEVRGRILAIASRILSTEGERGLSIRRITGEMGYSAGIVYHYFKSKEDILAHILKEGHQHILTAVRPPDEAMPPDEAIRAALINYVYNGMRNAAEYRSIMFNSSGPVLEVTAVLAEGASEKRPALRELAAALSAGVAAGLFAPCDIELTAQTIWSAVYGLLARLIVERDIPPRQRSRLIERQIDMLLRGIRA
ncbi:MAG: TetR/AcrR family transcriptional regulator [Oscillospiraceae bacterium]|nr:TetR/AcrR family transcriptional regulator [Oscillospiraceae bacterium]